METHLNKYNLSLPLTKIKPKKNGLLIYQMRIIEFQNETKRFRILSLFSNNSIFIYLYYLVF